MMMTVIDTYEDSFVISSYSLTLWGSFFFSWLEIYGRIWWNGLLRKADHSPLWDNPVSPHEGRITSRIIDRAICWNEEHFRLWSSEWKRNRGQIVSHNDHDMWWSSWGRRMNPVIVIIAISFMFLYNWFITPLITSLRSNPRDPNFK